MSQYVRSWLYVPAEQPGLLDKAMAGSADAVVYDLEDAVAADAKDTARSNVVEALSTENAKALWVRINDPAGPTGRTDVETLRGTKPAGVRIPKAESPELVAETAEELGTPVHLLIESALGLQRAYELASCHPLVKLVSLGEADLKADLRLRDDEGLQWARQRVVTAARAARLPSPVHSVWTDIQDVEGLAEDTRRAARQGMFGRSVVHPAQIDVVNTAFTPAKEEVDRARALIRSVRHAGGWLDDRGRFIDAAVLAQARWLVDLANSLAV